MAAHADICLHKLHFDTQFVPNSYREHMSWLKARDFEQSRAGRSGDLVLNADTQESQVDVSQCGYLGGGSPGGQ